MKAALLHPHALEVATVPEPRTPDGWSLIEVEACGICGSDLHVYEGDEQYRWALDLVPYTPGHESVGRVVRSSDPTLVGRRVITYPRVETSAAGPTRRIGFEVQGALAQRFSAPTHCLVPIPDDIPLATAVLAEPLTVVLNALSLVDVADVRSPVVFGMGAIGLLAGEEIARRTKADVHVYGTAADEEIGSFEVAAGLGLVPCSDSPDNAREYDFAFNAAGAAAAITRAIEFLAPGSTLLNVALGIGDVPINVDRLVRKRLTFMNSYGSESENWPAAADLLSNGAITGKGLVSEAYALERVDAAFAALSSRRSRKIIVIP